MANSMRGERVTCWCGQEGEVPPRSERDQWSDVYDVAHEGEVDHRARVARFDDDYGVRFRFVEVEAGR